MRSGELGVRRGLRLGVAGLLVAAPWGGWAQVAVRPAAFAGVDGSGHAVTVEAALRTMAGQAAVMFVGTVSGVKRVGGDGFSAAGGVVEITFVVERGIRGVADGDGYVLREWGGLWAGGEQRYRTGARLLMLLHAPGATGLSSPVGGLDGAIPVVGSSPVVRGSEDATAAEDVPVVDLRWLAAKLGRSVGYRQAGTTAAGATAGTGVRVSAKAVAAAGTSMVRAGQTSGTAAAEETVALEDASVPTAQASVATVLGMMSSWTKDEAKGASDAR